MKIISRNVNWIRAVVKKWFVDFVKDENPDILCVQEVKAKEYQIPEEMHLLFSDYNYIRNSAERPWYAGTAIFYKKKLNLISSKVNFDGINHFNSDWRLTELRFQFDWKGVVGSKNIWKEIVLLNNYFPNWWTRADWTEMLLYKLKYYDYFIDYIKSLENDWKIVISCGDFNICHEEIDIARPDANKNSIWFLPIERKKIGEIFDSWFVDVFRYFNPWLADQYTRWSYRAGARPRNVWRRLDYFVVSKKLLENIDSIGHLVNIYWSDHCPISLLLT